MRLLAFFRKNCERGTPMVLASVVDTGGSTYSKAGEMMLIDEGDNFCGMLSGGCLEGDLVERARRVYIENQSQIATYDLSQDDELWGLGIGCEGTMHVFLQPLLAAENYAPFDKIAAILNSHGAAEVDISRDYRILVSPPPTLLVLGAGADSEPLVNTALELGWRCTVVDHRPAYVQSRNYGIDAIKHCCEVDRVSTDLTLSEYDLAIVMSHHLHSDRDYLAQLAATDIQYVGLLGPAKRRDRLMRDLGDVADRLTGRLRAPAGLQLGGRGAGSIAVEIIAEMQQFVATHER